ncbi:hypothetical protein AB0M92_20230 [Streptomyces sp. NPDC051582]|uniref:hypothetical protein n=1 Tax=Streptomyces sp. NPDC051582 TaxID=3155167 RepID=UPI0034172E70
MTNTLLAPSQLTTGPPVFDDPRGRRRRILTAAGTLVCAVCLLALAAAVGVLYADPHAPAPAGAATTRSTR